MSEGEPPPCETCAGTGLIGMPHCYEIPCPDCGGKGRVEQPASPPAGEQPHHS